MIWENLNGIISIPLHPFINIETGTEENPIINKNK